MNSFLFKSGKFGKCTLTRKKWKIMKKAKHLINQTNKDRRGNRDRMDKMEMKTIRANKDNRLEKD